MSGIVSPSHLWEHIGYYLSLWHVSLVSLPFGMLLLCWWRVDVGIGGYALGWFLVGFKRHVLREPTAYQQPSVVAAHFARNPWLALPCCRLPFDGVLAALVFFFADKVIPKEEDFQETSMALATLLRRRMAQVCISCDSLYIALRFCSSFLLLAMKLIGYTTSIILGTTQFAGGKALMTFVAKVSTM